MKPLFTLTFVIYVALTAITSTDAQRRATGVPLETQVRILKAEDERRFDTVLEGLLKDPSEAVRVRAALAAGRIGDAAAVPSLVRLLASDRSEKVLEMAAFALGEIESIDAADAILRLIGETGKAMMPNAAKANVRGRLAEAAGKIAAANVKHAKAKDLGQAIVFTLEAEDLKKAKQDKETVLLALTAALRARPEGAAETVAKFLVNLDARVRADAANTLARLRAKNANEELRAMLASDPDPVARANAARALGAAEDKEALEILLKAATDDTDQRVRVSAVRSLASLKDAKAAEPLLSRAEKIFALYKASHKADVIPSENSEFAEVAVTLGRLLANTRNERAVNLFREYGKLDKGRTPEVYIARLRIAPGRGDGGGQELTSWRQYSTLAQLIGEVASLEPTDEEGKAFKAQGPAVVGPLARAYATADPSNEGELMLAGPELLSAYAKFKTEDLDAVLRDGLKNKDTFIRATSASLLGDQPASKENLDALNKAMEYAIFNDREYNDAVLATLEALFKLDKKAAVPAMELGAGSLDHLVRRRVHEMMNDESFKGVELTPILKNIDKAHLLRVKPHAGRGTKIGQVLNTDADYRRAASRKNGTVKAVLTTQKGNFTIDLLPEDSPLTVDNFVKLANAKYFDGLEVHRVVPNFVMQDGDARGDGNGGPGWSIRCEINMVDYGRGAVGMALSGKDTGGSQWFVTHSPQPHLDGGYTVFGQVNEKDMAVVDKIVRGDKILTVRITENR